MKKILFYDKDFFNKFVCDNPDCDNKENILKVVLTDECYEEEDEVVQWICANCNKLVGTVHNEELIETIKNHCKSNFI